MEEEKKKKKRKKRKLRKDRVSSSFTMRFDAFTLEMLERISYDEDKMRPEAIRSAVKHLFIKKYGDEEIKKLRKKYRPNFLKNGKRTKDINGTQIGAEKALS